MDSLLASYASSDEEEHEHDKSRQIQTHKSHTSFSATTNPNSSLTKSFFSSLPPPKSNQLQTNPSSQFDFFSSKSQLSQDPGLIPSKSQLFSHDPEFVSEKSQLFGSEFEAKKKPSSSLLFSSLPKPKNNVNGDDEFSDVLEPKKPGLNSPFSALPKPKTHRVSARDVVDARAKNVVQFRPPVNPDLLRINEDDEDSDDEKERRKRREEAENVRRSGGGGSFTSRMGMPAPKNSAVLGALPSSAGTGRRSVLEADGPVSSSSVAKTEVKVNEGSGVGYSDNANYAAGAQSLNPTLASAYDVNYGDYAVGAGAETLNPSPANAYDANYAEYAVGSESLDPNSTNVYDVSYANYAGYENVGGDATSYGPASEDYANYGGYAGYESSGQYENKWIDRSGGVAGQQVYEAAVESVVKVPGKRGRTEIPQEVIEVKQDELMKNRPREDQAKATGIAFGPAYQPVSTKGKPSKLHKRKHQIGSLYFDMRQKEMELAERRSKGFLTKAETHAKYGW